MADHNEIEALKASLRGALAAASALSAVQEKVEALDARADVADADLEEIARLSLAHAIAAQALRGLVETMRSRRGTSAA